MASKCDDVAQMHASQALKACINVIISNTDFNSLNEIEFLEKMKHGLSARKKVLKENKIRLSSKTKKTM